MKNNKKILFVDFSEGYGGSAGSLKNIILGIKPLGYEAMIAFLFQKDSFLIDGEFYPKSVKVKSLRGSLTDAYYFLSRPLRDNEKIRNLQISRVFLSILNVSLIKIPTICRLVYIIYSEGIRIIHINNGISVPIIFAANITKAKCVVSLRSFVYPKMARLSIVRKVDFFVANSEAVKKDFISKSRVEESKVEVIYNGINFAKVREKVAHNFREKNAKNRDKTTKTIGTIGRLVAWKRQDLLIEAVDLLVKKGVDIKCFIFGEPENNWRANNYASSLFKMVSEKNLEKHIYLFGFCSNQIETIQTFDIFVLPSVLEPFGNVVLESMAIGVPVIAFNGGGPVDIINDKIDGLLVPIGNVEELATAILKLINDYDLYARISQNACERVRSEFNIEKSIQKWDKLYQTCLLQRVSNR